MSDAIKTKFFTFDQNNSGGYFVEDIEQGVCEYVIIEAKNFNQACDILRDIGSTVSGFFDYCLCDGERWSDWGDDSDGTNEPMIYGEKVSEKKQSVLCNQASIHYYNRTIKHYRFDKKGEN